MIYKPIRKNKGFTIHFLYMILDRQTEKHDGEVNIKDFIADNRQRIHNIFVNISSIRHSFYHLKQPYDTIRVFNINFA